MTKEEAKDFLKEVSYGRVSENEINRILKDSKIKFQESAVDSIPKHCPKCNQVLINSHIYDALYCYKCNENIEYD